MQLLNADQDVLDKLHERERDLREWLAENAPECDQEQAHLDVDTRERVYWHYGYAVAVRDVLALLAGNASTRVEH